MSTLPADPTEFLPAHAIHPRVYRDNHFVYPVLSRRSRGLSLGINLNPDRVCNFDCVYCQVDRHEEEAPLRFMAVDRLIAELEAMLDRVADGSLVAEAPFRDVPAADRSLKDIAFSGDGEPTAYRNIDTIVAAVADLKRRRGLDQVKIVLITNASLLDRSHVRRALTVLDLNQGEVWAKLDAGTPEWFDRVNRTGIPFDRILRNLRETARARPIVIQSLFLRLDGQAPPAGEVDAFAQRLRAIQAAGGHIDRVQVYTIARQPAEAHATPLETPILEEIASRVNQTCGIPVEVFPGRAGESG